VAGTPGRLALTSPAPIAGARDRPDLSAVFFTAPFISLPLRSVPREGPRRPSSHREGKAKRKKQLQTVDRSAPASMKNAANCVNQCELQDTLIIDVSNAHGGSGSLPEPRPVEGRFLPLRDFAAAHPVASRTVPRGSAPRGRLRVRGTRSARVLSLPALRGARRALGGRSRHRPPFGALLALGPRRGARLPSRGLPSFFRPQLGRDDPLNLSILLRGGKENNDDSLSKGD
jgi:hypothetical protein